MSYRKLFWGVLLIAFGLLIILKNFDILHFTWYSVFRLWPLLLILWGISVIPAKDWIKLVLSILVIAIGFWLLGKYGQYSFGDRWFRGPFSLHERWYDRDRDKSEDYYWDEDEDDYDSDSHYQSFTEPYDSTILFAELRMDAAAGAFDITNISDELIEFDKHGFLGDYSMITHDLEDKRILNISLTEGSIRRSGRNRGDQVEIKLNNNPVWDFDFDIGAASMDLDLSMFKTQNVEIDGGAASIELKLGDLYNDTRVNIDAGATSITIRVPMESGCELFTSTVLSSRSITGFEKISRNTYRTDNFENAENVIEITVDVAVSDLNIKRY